MTAELALAGRGRRLVATLVDVILVPGLAILLMLVSGVLEDADDWAASSRPYARIVLLGVASYLSLNGYLLWRRGQTVGKFLAGIAVVTAQSGEKLPLWKLLGIRALFFPTLYLIVWPGPFIVPLIDQLLILGRGRRCLHDVVCGSAVIRRHRTV